VNGAWIRLRFSDHWSCKPVARNCLVIVDESALRVLRQEVRHELLAKVQKHDAWQLLRAIPFIGPIRAALLIAWIQTPHRIRTKRQLWTERIWDRDLQQCRAALRPGRAAASHRTNGNLRVENHYSAPYSFMNQFVGFLTISNKFRRRSGMP
jgi:hypothetical protein